MEIILLKNIEKVGRKFEIVKVKNGYGRNYLIPEGLAIIANDTNRNNLDSYKRQEAAKLEAMVDHFREIAAKINGKTLQVAAKCGVSGKIFGSVTTLQISKLLQEQFDVEVDRRDILMPENVKMIGTYEASLDLHPDVEANFSFEVEPDDPKIAYAIEEAKAKEAAEERARQEAREARAAAEAAEAAPATEAAPAAAEEEE